MKKWIKAFFAVDNSVNENTVMGIIASFAALGFGIAAIFIPGALPPMFSFLTFGAACFGLNLKFK